MTANNKSRVLSTLAAAAVLAPALGLLGAPAASAGTTTDITTIAAANVGLKACSQNSAGGIGYYTSCTGDGGSPENWCADFAKWVWAQAGADVRGLTPAAGSFGVYGRVHYDAHVGDAVLFNYNGGNYADHVAIVTAVNANGTITTIGGNQAGSSPGTSVVQRVSNYSGAIGYSPTMGQNISGYVSPRGVSGGSSDSAPVGKVFDNIRFDNGNWQGAAVADNNATINQVVDAAMPNGDLHVVTLAGGKVYDNIRFANGTWQGASLLDGNGHITAIAAASTPNGELHVETLSYGKVYDNVRHTDATWQGAQLLDGSGAITSVAAAGLPNGDFHVETLAGGIVYDNVKFANGTWQGAAVADGGGHVSAIALAGMANGDLHLETLSNGIVYDNVRFANGSWQGAATADGGGHVTSMAITGLPNGDLHLETLSNGIVYDNVRHSDASWQGAAVSDGGGHTLLVTIAGMPNGDMHLGTLA